MKKLERRHSFSHPSKSDRDERAKRNEEDLAKQQEEKLTNKKQAVRKKALQVLKGLNALSNATVARDNFNMGIATAGVGVALVQGGKEPKKWYQKAWSGVVSGVTAAYKAVTGNVAAIVLTSLTLVTAVASGGTVPIVVASVLLGLKVVRTAIDAKKAAQTRRLNEENDALIEYATQAILQQELLRIEPKLQQVKELGKNQLDKANGQDLVLGKKTEMLERVVGILENTVGATGAVVTNPAKALGIVGKAVIITTKNVIIREITKTPELRAELIKLINSERKDSNISYDDIQKLKEQTRKLKIENDALKETMREKKFYSFSNEQIAKTFEEKKTQIESKTLPVKKESTAKIIFTALKDALNPLSTFNKVKEHSGMVKAIRREEANLKKPEIDSNSKIKRRSTDDINVSQKKPGKYAQKILDERKKEKGVKKGLTRAS